MRLFKILLPISFLFILLLSCRDEVYHDKQDDQNSATNYSNAVEEGTFTMTNQDFFDPSFANKYLDLPVPENFKLKPGAESILNEIFLDGNSDAIATLIVNRVGVPIWSLGIEDDNDDGSFFIVPLVNLENSLLKGVLVKNENTSVGIRMFNVEEFYEEFNDSYDSHNYLNLLFKWYEETLDQLREVTVTNRSSSCEFYTDFKGRQACGCNNQNAPFNSCIAANGCNKDCQGNPIGGDSGGDSEGGPKEVGEVKVILPISNISGGFLPNINTAWETLGFNFGDIKAIKFGEDGSFGVNYPPNWDVEVEAGGDNNEVNIDIKDPMELLEDQLSVFAYLYGLEDRYEELLEILINTGLGENVQDYKGFEEYMRYILIQEIDQQYYNSQMDENHKWWIFDNFEKYPMIIDYLKGHFPGIPASPNTLTELLDLILAYSQLDLSEDEMIHLLTFESNLIQDVDAFLSNNPVSSYKFDIVVDFISLQTCGNTLPCVPKDLPNELEALNYFYEYTSYDNRIWINKSENIQHKNQIQWNLINFGEDELAREFIDDHLTRLREDPLYKEFVETTFGWSGVMWSIAKELIGDKVVDILIQFIPGFGNADEIRDAIKAFKNGDWLEFTVEVGKIVVNNTPFGKLLKSWDAVDQMYDYYNKVEKVWNKIEGFAENVIEQMWNIVKSYPSSLRTNTDLIGGIAKAIKRGLKTIDEVMEAIPGFTAMSNSRMKHILHGDTGGGLHHASGLVNDPSKKVVEMVSPNSKGVYRVKYQYVDADGVPAEKWSSMFPNNKSEIQVAKSIENVFDNPVSEEVIDNGVNRLLKGTDSTGVPIEIITDINYNVITAYPIFN